MKKRMSKKFRMSLGVYLHYLLLMSVILSTVTLANYTSNSSTYDEARIAFFRIEANGTREPGALGDVNVGEENKYLFFKVDLSADTPVVPHVEFDVINGDYTQDVNTLVRTPTKASEVAIGYYINVIFDEVTVGAVTPKLYLIENNENTEKPVKVNGTLIYGSGYSGQFSPAVAEKHVYRLEIDIDETLVQDDFEIEDMQIEIIAEQID